MIDYKLMSSNYENFSFYFDLSRIEIDFWTLRVEIYLPFKPFRQYTKSNEEVAQ